jgi:glutaredoxin
MIIKLYTGDSCPACKGLKKRLDKLSLSNYTECNISDIAIKEELIALGLRSIPVLAVYNNNGVMLDTLVGNVASDSHLEEFFSV